MTTPTGRFERSERLLDSRDYRRVSARGRRASAGSFVLISAAGRGGEDARPRLGITASRKVGNAVVRNSVKRRVREWFRHGRGKLPAGSDWVVIARRSAAGLDGREVARDLDRLATRLVSKRGRS